MPGDIESVLVAGEGDRGGGGTRAHVEGRRGATVRRAHRHAPAAVEEGDRTEVTRSGADIDRVDVEGIRDGAQFQQIHLIHVAVEGAPAPNSDGAARDHTGIRQSQFRLPGGIVPIVAADEEDPGSRVQGDVHRRKGAEIGQRRVRGARAPDEEGVPSVREVVHGEIASSGDGEVGDGRGGRTANGDVSIDRDLLGRINDEAGRAIGLDQKRAKGSVFLRLDRPGGGDDVRAAVLKSSSEILRRSEPQDSVVDRGGAGVGLGLGIGPSVRVGFQHGENGTDFLDLPGRVFQNRRRTTAQRERLRSRIFGTHTAKNESSGAIGVDRDPTGCPLHPDKAVAGVPGAGVLQRRDSRGEAHADDARLSVGGITERTGATSDIGDAVDTERARLNFRRASVGVQTTQRDRVGLRLEQATRTREHRANRGVASMVQDEARSRCHRARICDLR